MVTRFSYHTKHLLKLLELLQTSQKVSSAQLDDDPSNQKNPLDSTTQDQALRHLKRTYHLERRTFL